MRDLIISLDECPGRKDFKLKIPPVEEKKAEEEKPSTEEAGSGMAPARDLPTVTRRWRAAVIFNSQSLWSRNNAHHVDRFFAT